MFNNFGVLGGMPNGETMVLIFILIVWSLAWKGLALWKAGRAGEKWWFVALLIVNTFGLFEIVYLFTENKKKMRAILVGILGVFIVVTVILISVVPAHSIDRIVYGTTQPDESTLTNWQADCSKRLGQFNTCGSPCDDSAEGCISVCAYTCENIPKLRF